MPAASVFLDQAASPASSATAFETSAVSAHDFSGVADAGLHTAVVDLAVAHSGSSIAHTDFTSMAHHDTSFAVGEFATHLLV